jgi:hypothetical protein
MTLNLSIRIADDRDFREQMHVFARLLHCERSFHAAVMEEATNGISYAQAYERVENTLEQVTGRRHYAEYGCYRVIKHRLQSRKNETNQLTLFK